MIRLMICSAFVSLCRCQEQLLSPGKHLVLPLSWLPSSSFPRLPISYQRREFQAKDPRESLEVSSKEFQETLRVWRASDEAANPTKTCSNLGIACLGWKANPAVTWGGKGRPFPSGPQQPHHLTQGQAWGSLGLRPSVTTWNSKRSAVARAQ